MSAHGERQGSDDKGTTEPTNTAKPTNTARPANLAEPAEAAEAVAQEAVAQRYRRVLALLPRAFREQRGEEMLTTMLDGAADAGRVRPSLGEWLSMLGFSLRLRSGAPGASPRARSAGENLRLIALLGLVLQAGTPRQVLRAGAWPGIDALLRQLSFQSWGPAAVAGYSLLVPCLAVAAFLRGWRRTGLLLMTASSVVFLATSPWVFGIGSDAWWANPCAMLVLCVIPLIAGLLGFHRDAPRVERPRWWLAAAILTSLSLLLSGDLLVIIAGEPSYALIERLWLPSRLFEFCCVCVVAVMMLRQARRSLRGPIARLVVAAPLLLVLPSAASALYLGTSFQALMPLSLDLVQRPTLTPYLWIGAYLLAAEVLLVLTLTGRKILGGDVENRLSAPSPG